jgi:hypothetical protein
VRFAWTEETRRLRRGFEVYVECGDGYLASIKAFGEEISSLILHGVLYTIYSRFWGDYGTISLR